jgi:hypothetical protein
MRRSEAWGPHLARPGGHSLKKLPAGDVIEELQGSSCRPVSIATPLPEGPLPASATRHLRLRLVAGASAGGAIRLQINVTNGGDQVPLTVVSLPLVTLPPS